MRRFLFLCVMLLCLTGCGDDKLVKKEIDSTECVDNKYVNTMTSIVEAEKGYYILRGNYDNFITYISKDNLDNEIYLCAKPECKHLHDMNKFPEESYEYCDSYIGKVIPYSLKYYDGNLYVIKMEEQQAVLYRISKDGSTHERLMVLGEASGNASHVFNYIVDGDTVYVIYKGEGFKKNEPSVFTKLSIKNQTREVIMEETTYSYDSIKMYNGGVYFRRILSEDSSEAIISRYDIGNGKVQDVARGAITMYTIDNVNNAVLYWQLDKGLMKYDMSTGEETLIREKTEEMIDVNLGCNGKYVAIYNAPSLEINPKIRLIMDIVDLGTNELVTTIDCATSFYFIMAIDEDKIWAEDFMTGSYAYIDMTEISGGKPLRWKAIKPFEN